MHPAAGLAALACGAAVGPVLARLATAFGAAARPWTATALSCVTFGAMGLAVGAGAALPAYLWLAAAAVPLALVDAQCRRLPNRLVLPCWAGGLVLLGAASAVQGEPEAYVRALVASATVFAVFYAVAATSPAGLGFGDVKLAGALGCYLGWLGADHVILGLFLGFAGGAGTALVLVAARRIGVRDTFPYGPPLLAGALAAVVVLENWPSCCAG